MRVSKGGTDMYCPSCKGISTCKKIPAADVTYSPRDHAQRMHYTSHQDIQFFQRGRECLSCGHKFVSAEVDLAFLRELVALRDAVSQVKGSAESYLKDANAASKSLKELSKAIQSLRGLKEYKRAEG